MTRTRQSLLENFDDEVREKLRIQDEASKAYLSRFERQLIEVTRHETQGHADFLDGSSFELTSCPFPGNIPLGRYELPRRSGEAHLYRLNHPLAEAVLAVAKQRELPVREIGFDYRGRDGKISILEPLIGKAGWLSLSNFAVESFDQAEDNMIFAAITDDGEALDEETARRLFTLPGRMQSSSASLVFVADVESKLGAITRSREKEISHTISDRNARFFEAEADKLDGWADDLKLGLEREIKELDRQIKESRRAATAAQTLEQKLAGQKQIKALESLRTERRRSLFDAQDRVDLQRDDLIKLIESKLVQQSESDSLFAIRWRLE